MISKHEMQCTKVLDFLDACGGLHAPWDFSVGVVKNSGELFGYDKARAYFFNGNGKIKDTYLVGVEKKWPAAYMEYYSQIEDGRYGIFPGGGANKRFNPYRPVSIRDWITAPDDEFVCDYIRPQGLSSTMAFSFYDGEGSLRICFMFDRTGRQKFCPEEQGVLSMAVPHLNNLYKNFFYSQQTERQKSLSRSEEKAELTARELEIAEQLCQGVSPANISRKLHISLSTAYKHISHIYEKLHVSSRQELLVRLLG